MRGIPARSATVGPVQLWIAAIVAAVLVSLSVGVSRASAADAYLHSGSFSEEGSGPGQLDDPRRVAIEPSTGNVFVADSVNDRVVVFAPDGAGATPLTTFDAGGTLDAPYGIALHESGGQTVVYVSDSGNDRIVKLASDEQAVPSFTVDGGFTSPALGSAPGEVGDFLADVAVDPSTGDLLVADPGDNLVQRYGADGSFDSAFDGTGSTWGSFTGLLDIDVAPNGDVYVVDSTGDVVLGDDEEPCPMNNYCDGAPSRVDRFAANGSHLASIQPLESTGNGTVAFDPSSSQVVVGSLNPQETFKFRSYAADGSPIQSFNPPNGGPDSILVFVPGIAFDAGASGRLYAVSSEVENLFQGGRTSYVGVHAFAPAQLPEAAVDPVSDVASSTAHVTGTVNPHGTETDWMLQYRRTGSETWADGPEGTATGTVDVPVAGDLSDLEPNAEYEVRLRAAGAGGVEVLSAPVEFTTDGVPPVATTRAAAPRTATTARLNAFVLPGNQATTYSFEWGRDGSYGNTAPVTAAAPVDGNRPVLATAALTGLEPGTTYHYRVVATNASGTDVGADQAFATRTLAEMAPRERGLELVTPVDKGGQTLFGHLVERHGTRAYWSALTGVLDSPVGVSPAMVAERGSEGWRSRAILPPTGDDVRVRYVAGASEDMSSLVVQLGAWKPFDPKTDPMTLMRYENGEQELLYETSNVEDQGVLGMSTRTADGTDHVYVGLNTPEHPSHQPGTIQVYDVGVGEPRLISKMPGTDSAPACSSNIGGRGDVESSRYQYFETAGDDCGGPVQLYVHDTQGTDDPGDDETHRVSPPPVAGDPAEARFTRATAAGDEVLFFTNASLTADDEDTMVDNSSADFYTWRVDGSLSCVTCFIDDARILIGNGAPSSLAVSTPVGLAPDDLSRLYIVSTRRLLPGLGEPGKENIYVIHEGQLDFVAVANDLVGTGVFEAIMTEDGSTLLFTSSSDPTGDNPSNRRQLYRYTATDGALECLTCSPSGGPALGIDNADMANFEDIGAPFSKVPASHRKIITTLSDDGRTVAILTRDKLLPRDVNGTPDVYEWRDGVLSLITDGVTETGTGVEADRIKLQGISGDGETILFRSPGRLTGYENDSMPHLYASRVGGGFGPPPRPPAGCADDDCQDGLPDAPAAPPVGSVELPGSGNVSDRGVRTSLRVSRLRTVAGPSARLRVRVPAAGTITVSARGVKRASRRVPRGGAYVLRVRLNPSARRSLAKRGRLRVGAKVVYRPRGGRSASTPLNLTFKRSSGTTGGGK